MMEGEVLVPSLPEPAVVVPEPSAGEVTFEAVYDCHFQSVWRTLRRLGVPDAQLDDAAQDVFVVVHRKLATFSSGSVRNWIYAISLRVASDYRKRATRHRCVPLSEEITDGRPGPGRLSELEESIRLLRALLGRLDDKRRTVFVLSELEQLTIPEIAEVLGVNLNTAYARLRAARAQFDAALTRHRQRRGTSL
jgi:RNA polymerase sigma-70 factor (ECF subfamily)